MLSLMYGLILFILCGLLLLSWRHERTIDRIEQTQLKQISVASNIVTVHNATVDHYDSEIDQIIGIWSTSGRDTSITEHQSRATAVLTGHRSSRRRRTSDGKIQ